MRYTVVPTYVQAGTEAHSVPCSSLHDAKLALSALIADAWASRINITAEIQNDRGQRVGPRKSAWTPLRPAEIVA